MSELIADIDRLAEAAAKKQDKEAYKKLYHIYGPTVYSLLLRYLENEELASKGLEVVFEEAWYKLSEYTLENGSFLGWMIQQTRSYCAQNRSHKLERSEFREQETVDKLISALATDEQAIIKKVLTASPIINPDEVDIKSLRKTLRSLHNLMNS